MKKFAFVALLSISVAALAVANGGSKEAGVASYITNVADTTPAHHTIVHKSVMHKKTMVKKPVKDSTKM